MSLRAGRRGGALLTLPLVSVSASHLVGWAVYKALIKSEFPTEALHITIDAVGLAIGLILCWGLARKIDLKRLRYTYFACCAIFLVAMFYAYANYLL